MCPQGHAFDVAREGYVNLMPVQAKSSKDPGYNAQLMQARHRFFGSGGYQQVAEALAERMVTALPSTASSTVPGGGSARVLDAGCGEGYYLRVLRKHSPGLKLVGTDVSRAGMKLASRLDAASACAVANSYHLPIMDGSMQGVISHFSPNPIDEFARVLTPGGSLLIGSPGANHLFALKEAVYETPRQHDEDNHLVRDDRFVHTDRTVVRYVLTIDEPDELNALLGMTPYSYGANTAEQFLASRPTGFSTDVHVLFDTYRYEP